MHNITTSINNKSPQKTLKNHSGLYFVYFSIIFKNPSFFVFCKKIKKKKKNHKFPIYREFSDKRKNNNNKTKGHSLSVLNLVCKISLLCI